MQAPMTRFRDRTSREEGTVVFLPSLLLNRRKYHYQTFFSPFALLTNLAISWHDGACIFRWRMREGTSWLGLCQSGT